MSLDGLSASPVETFSTLVGELRSSRRTLSHGPLGERQDRDRERHHASRAT